jgi:hypothetical protein
MCGLFLLKISNFCGNIMDKYIISYHFKKNWPNFDIIVIIMWEFGERKFELSSLEPPCRRSRQRSSLFMRRHLLRPELVTPLTTHALSPSPWHHSLARNVVHPASFPIPRRRPPAPSSGPQRHRPPRAHDVVIPMTSQSPRCRWTHAAPKPTTPSSSPSPQGYIVYFSLLFSAYKSWFWYATLSHCFDMLHCFCSGALFWCDTLAHCFDILHCL